MIVRFVELGGSTCFTIIQCFIRTHLPLVYMDMEHRIVSTIKSTGQCNNVCYPFVYMHYIIWRGEAGEETRREGIEKGIIPVFLATLEGKRLKLPAWGGGGYIISSGWKFLSSPLQGSEKHGDGSFLFFSPLSLFLLQPSPASPLLHMI